ncbi:MAG: hypothetical protein H6716_17150 [Polyangiaceae bacterium]|nr:hypothetical protein [Polyangiaceae bacterium]
MSVDAGWFAQISGASGVRGIVEALLESGWSRKSEGWWCIPQGSDPSDWTLIQEGLLELADAKSAAGETFGVRLWWENTDIGGEFLVFPRGELVFSPTTQRVTLDGRVTDVSWYLPKLLGAFAKSQLQLESWEWRETA